MQDLSQRQFEVGVSYRSDEKGPTTKVVARIETDGATEILVDVGGHGQHALDVMWCDLAGSEVVELPAPWSKACYAKRSGL